VAEAFGLVAAPGPVIGRRGRLAFGPLGPHSPSRSTCPAAVDRDHPARVLPRPMRENQLMEHLSTERLMAGLDLIRAAPPDGGRLVLIVRRPSVDEREVLAEAVLSRETGLAGDNWLARGSSRTPDGSADPHKQITVMNARVAELVAGGTDRMALCGDQLYLDLDLSVDNLPAGSLLAVGQAVLRVSEAPHTGCAKFVERFGGEAMRFVNGRIGRQLRMRGINASVVVPGPVRLGDLAVKAPLPPEGGDLVVVSRGVGDQSL